MHSERCRVLQDVPRTANAPAYCKMSAHSESAPELRGARFKKEINYIVRLNFIFPFR